jgi:hypothetical protein
VRGTRFQQALVSENDEFRVRNVGTVCPYEGTRIWVDHLREAEPGEDGHSDAGEIGLMIEAGGESVQAFLSPQDALMLADRLQRAADLVLETTEDVPDADREYQRLTRRP